jgi:hypothetical protein
VARPIAVAGCGIAIAAALPQGSAAAAGTRDTGRIPAHQTLSGVVEHGPAQDSAAFGTWRGRRVTVVTDFLGGNTWSSIANTWWTGHRWAGTRYHYVWSMFMLPTQQSGSMTKGAAGAYNGYFRSAAKGLVANGYGSSTIRLGWENTGNWYAWSATRNPRAYAAYWRQIVRTMRSVPGAHFTFDFNISDQGIDPRRAWPGDAYVDYVGGDFYDESWASSYRPSNHAKVWRHIRTMPFGLDWVARFAAQHHKRVSLPEWALVHRCDGHGGGDDPYYIRAMHSWIASHDVAYETYFNGEDNPCQSFRMSTKHFTKARSTYRALW